MSQTTVLVVGGTGRTGSRVISQLLARGFSVRAIVRSRAKLATLVQAHPGLEVIERNLLELTPDELQVLVRGCDAVISCLGHVISFKGIFGKPRDLVTRATRQLCEAIAENEPDKKVRFVLMSSVSVNRPEHLDGRRSWFERAFLWVLRGLVPPTRDNQRAADYLQTAIGRSHPFIEWAVLRPDTLEEGGLSEYVLHEGLVDSLFAPGHTNLANVAHFLCELATDEQAWARWEFQLPVITNVAHAARA